MNKIKKIYTMLLLFSTVGILYSIFILKGIPETFDWNLEEDTDEDY
jgi:hypothetical protein